MKPKVEIVTYGADLEFIQIYPSIIEASKNLGVESPNIVRAAKPENHHFKAGGVYVRLRSDVTDKKGNILKKIKISADKDASYSLYNLEGHRVKVFSGIKEASEFFDAQIQWTRDIAKTGAMAFDSDSNPVFLVSGQEDSVKIEPNDNARPVRLYNVIKDAKCILSTYDVNAVATLLKVSNKLIHSAAIAFRVIKDEFTIHFIEIKPLKATPLEG